MADTPLPVRFEPRQIWVRRFWAVLVWAGAWWIALVAGFGLGDSLYAWVGWLVLVGGFLGCAWALVLLTLDGRRSRVLWGAAIFWLPLGQMVWGLAFLIRQG
jgi:hypothetical protein